MCHATGQRAQCFQPLAREQLRLELASFALQSARVTQVTQLVMHQFPALQRDARPLQRDRYYRAIYREHVRLHGQVVVRDRRVGVGCDALGTHADEHAIMPVGQQRHRRWVRGHDHFAIR